MNIPVISSNKIDSSQPEKNMHKVLPKLHRHKIKTSFFTVPDLLVYQDGCLREANDLLHYG